MKFYVISHDEVIGMFDTLMKAMNYTVEQFPSTILLVVRSLFTVFLIIFAIKETYNLVTQFLTTGKVGGDK